jgi:predicted ATPase
MITEIRARNILSFGPNTEPLELRGLNVFIGPNGSGKSNLIEILSLFQACPRDLVVPVREGGGVQDWLWKGASNPVAEIQVVVERPTFKQPIRHSLSFRAGAGPGHRFEVSDERIENATADPGHTKPYFYFGYENGRAMLNTIGADRRVLGRADIHPEKSILAQRRDPYFYREITELAEYYEKIRLYRDWSFGRNTAARAGQNTDLPSDFLAEDASNLAVVLSALRRGPANKNAIVEDLRQLYEGVADYEAIVEGGKVQLYLNENNRLIPATRLSDGTLRLMCLLCILHHPTPPPLVAIEEPELGLHPDVLPRLAEILREASTRTQLLVTTHSDTLVDALSDDPEAVVVTERSDACTSFTRLRAEGLRAWLAKYSLGQLWTRGDLGGTRW